MPTHTDQDLAIDELEAPGELRLIWRGKSNDREPGRFLMPLLQGALERAGAHRTLVLDFTQVDYLNSSTFTPLVKLLDEAARAQRRVVLEYSETRKWQRLSFNALKAFETPDGRISLRAR